MSVCLMFPIPRIPEEVVERSKHSLLIGSPKTCKTSLLFQCLKTVAAQRKATVLFIAPRKVMKLPTNVHKMMPFVPSSADKLMNVYISTADDLLEFLAEIHTYGLNPCFIAVDDFDVFMKRRKRLDISYSDYAAKIMSFLVDTAIHCNDCSVCVSVDIEDEDEHHKNVIIGLGEYYFEQIWLINKTPSLGKRCDYVMNCDKISRCIHYYVEDDQIFLENIKDTGEEFI